ncbi:MAG: YtxH domain-containing protein [Cytophagaceae bacterium]|nr:YtxH domain-containing protein [Cytophagaceae bacterium]
MSNNGRIFLGVVTAAAVGAVVGLLFAPEDGDKTRNKLRKGTNNLADELLNALQRGKEQYETIKDSVKDKASELRGRAESKYDDLKEQANDAKDQAQGEYQAGKGRVKDQM